LNCALLCFSSHNRYDDADVSTYEAMSASVKVSTNIGDVSEHIDDDDTSNNANSDITKGTFETSTVGVKAAHR
jgi:hypothetical protein